VPYVDMCALFPLTFLLAFSLQSEGQIASTNSSHNLQPSNFTQKLFANFSHIQLSNVTHNWQDPGNSSQELISKHQGQLNRAKEDLGRAYNHAGVDQLRT